MYRMQANPCRPGYHRTYGETTKHVPEASVLNLHPLTGWLEPSGM
jgi:hypothetical protein